MPGADRAAGEGKPKLGYFRIKGELLKLRQAVAASTIRSVLLQGYPTLEYVIVDGASTDESRSIIERYAGWLSYWVSEPDRGQSHAINKGLARCGGEVFNWLNSDDQLMPGALAEVATLRVATQAAMLVGRGVIVDAQSGRIRHDWAGRPPRHPLDFTRSNRVVVAQPSAFLDARLVRQVGGLREDLQCVLDWELYLRLTVLLRERLTTATTPALLSYALYHPRSKTSSHQADLQPDARPATARAGAAPSRGLRAGGCHPAHGGGRVDCQSPLAVPGQPVGSAA